MRRKKFNMTDRIGDITPGLVQVLVKLSIEEVETFQDLNNLSEDVLLRIAAIYPLVIQYIGEQTPALCLTAVKKDPMILRFVKEQTPELCMRAVQKYGRSVKHVKNQTEDICLVAVKNDWRAIRWVKWQTPEMCKAALKKAPSGAKKFITIKLD